MIQQDHISVVDIFDVKWEEARKACQDSQDEYINAKIPGFFEESDFTGFASKITSILDKGYSIKLFDNRLRIKNIVIVRSEDLDNHAIARTQSVFFSALSFFETIKQSAKVFSETLDVNEPYKYEDYFSERKINLPLVSTLKHHPSRLDKVLAEANIHMVLQKSQDQGYELYFETKHIFQPNSKIFTLKFNKLTDK